MTPNIVLLLVILILSNTLSVGVVTSKCEKNTNVFITPNNILQANSDQFTVSMNKKVYLDVLENDDVSNFENVTIISVGFRDKGSLKVVNGSEKQFLEYLPSRDLHGFAETFEYTISDGISKSSTFGTIFVKNTQPQADDFEVLVPKNSINFVIDLNSKFRDFDDGQTLSLKIIDQLKNSNGNYSLNITQETKSYLYYSGQYEVNNYQLLFTPSSNEEYIDSLQYEVSDGIISSTRATITFNITNFPPICNDVFKNTVKGVSYVWDLKSEAGCIDDNGDNLTLSLPENIDQTRANISLVGQNVIYKPFRSGTHQFNFQVNDGYVTVMTKVIVTTLNNAPVCSNIITSFNKGFNMVHIIDVLPYCIDPDNDMLFLKSVMVVQPECGVISLQNQKIKYQPPNGFSGNCTVQFTVTDMDMDSEGTATAQIHITLIDLPPVAVDDYFQFTQGMDAFITISTLLQNDYDLDGDYIEFVGIDFDACSLPGYCHNIPFISGANIIVPSDPLNCNPDKFMYKIRSLDNPSLEASATVTIDWVNCV